MHIYFWAENAYQCSPIPFADPYCVYKHSILLAIDLLYGALGVSFHMALNQIKASCCIPVDALPDANSTDSV